MLSAKRIFHRLLSAAIRHGALTVQYWDGDRQTYGQGQPYFTMTLHSPRAVWAMLARQSLGFGEAYADGLITIDGPLGQVARLSRENTRTLQKSRLTRRLTLWLSRVPHWPHWWQRNQRRHQQSYIQHHYDLGNDFYKLWLDKSLTYSCAYFRTPDDSLETAQRQKVAHLLRKLQLRPGMRLLDIGSGWGTLLITAARDYGVTGLGVTLSQEQSAHSMAAAQTAGLAGKIRFELANYQDLAERDEHFDRIISVGMFEHVGQGNSHQYYRTIDRLLRPGGLSVLHTITAEFEHPANPWVQKYIFPGGYIPSLREIVRALPDYDFHLLDYENLRLHYAMTLDEWRARFRRHRPEVLAMYDERFYRMWDLWLASSAASFRYGSLGLSQLVWSKGHNHNNGLDLPLTREFLYPASQPPGALSALRLRQPIRFTADHPDKITRLVVARPHTCLSFICASLWRF